MLKQISLLVCVLFLFQVSPSQITQWQELKGPEGGNVRSIGFLDSLVFIGTSGGVFVSSDNGERWTSSGLTNTTTTKIVAGSKYIFAGTTSGVYRSSDFGKTWQSKNAGLGYYASSIGDIVVKDSILLIAIFDRGIFKSTSWGEQWFESNAGINNREIRTLFVGTNAVMASAAGASGSGMFRSSDKGTTWVRLDPDPYASYIATFCKWGNTIYGAKFENYAKIWASTDDGLTWRLSGGTAPNDLINSVYANANGLFVGTYRYGVYKSMNDGASWQSINNGLYNYDIALIGGKDQRIFVCSADGIHTSSNGGSLWLERNGGLSNAQVTSLETYQTTMFAGTYGAGMFRSTNGGLGWAKVNLGINGPYVFDIVRFRNSICAVVVDWIYGGVVMVSQDGGNNWTRTANNIGAGALQKIAANNSYVFLASDYGMFRSANYGATWQLMSDGVENNGRPNVAQIAAIDSIIIAVNGSSSIMRSTNNGNSWITRSVSITGTPPIQRVSAISNAFYLGCSQVNIILRSTDFGLTWQQLQSPLFNAGVSCIIGSGDSVLAGLSAGYDEGGGVIVSTNKGTTWRYVIGGLSNPNVKTLTFNQGRFFAGTWGRGVYRSVDSLELPGQAVLLSPVAYSFGQSIEPIFVWSSNTATSSRLTVSKDRDFSNITFDGIVENVFTKQIGHLERHTIYYWRVIPINQFGTGEQSATGIFTTGMPENIFLDQNYPNPFNGNTTIRFSISKQSHVSLKVYDLIGRELTTLVLEEMKPGNYERVFAATEFASGVYFYQLRAGDFVATRKLLLLR